MGSVAPFGVQKNFCAKLGSMFQIQNHLHTTYMEDEIKTKQYEVSDLKTKDYYLKILIMVS